MKKKPKREFSFDLPNSFYFLIFFFAGNETASNDKVAKNEAEGLKDIFFYSLLLDLPLFFFLVIFWVK